MKKILLISALTLAATTAYADNTATTNVTASGKVIAALEVSQATEMAIPDLVVPASGEPNTSVTVNCTTASTTPSSLTYTANGSPFTHGDITASAGVNASSANVSVSGANSTGACAKLDVTGQADYHFTVTETDAAAGGGIVISSLACTPDNLTLSATTGTSSLYCGATATASTNTTVGTYTSVAAGTVTVTYD